MERDLVKAFKVMLDQLELTKEEIVEHHRSYWKRELTPEEARILDEMVEDREEKKKQS